MKNWEAAMIMAVLLFLSFSMAVVHKGCERVREDRNSMGMLEARP